MRASGEAQSAGSLPDLRNLISGVELFHRGRTVLALDLALVRPSPQRVAVDAEQLACLADAVSALGLHVWLVACHGLSSYVTADADYYQHEDYHDVCGEYLTVGVLPVPCVWAFVPPCHYLLVHGFCRLDGLLVFFGSLVESGPAEDGLHALGGHAELRGDR